MTIKMFCVSGVRRLAAAYGIIDWLLLGGLIFTQASQSGDFGYTVATNNTVTIPNYTGPGGGIRGGWLAAQH